MDYQLTELQTNIRDLCAQIAEDKIKPVRERFDETGEFPHEVMQVFAETGLFGLFIEEQYGGMGGGVMDLVIAVETLSKACSGIALGLAATALGTFPIILFGNEDQKQKHLTRIAGGTIAAFALTEPEAGSDAAAMKTTARKDG